MNFETYEFRKAREATENWCGDVYECKATLDDIKTLLKDEIE